eukprot:542733-Pyramimonas_sp.AAC.1
MPPRRPRRLLRRPRRPPRRPWSIPRGLQVGSDMLNHFNLIPRWSRPGVMGRATDRPNLT